MVLISLLMNVLFQLVKNMLLKRRFWLVDEAKEFSSQMDLKEVFI